MANQPNLISAYTLSQPLTALNPRPINAKRAPQASDTGYILGQLWIYSATQSAYILVQVAGGAAVWQLIESGGSSGVFSTLTSTGATTLATTGASVNTFGNTTGATSVGILVGTGGFTLTGVAGSTITIGTGVTTGTLNLGTAITTGNINIGGTGGNAINIGNGANTAAQTVDIASGTYGANTTVNILDGVGTAGTATFSLLGNTAQTQAGVVNIGTGGSIGGGTNAVTVGSIAGTSHTIIQGGTSGVTLTAPFVALPGPVYIYTGAGVPSNGLALHVGDLYINTTAASTTTRLYIATAASTWTFFTSNA